MIGNKASFVDKTSQNHEVSICLGFKVQGIYEAQERAVMSRNSLVYTAHTEPLNPLNLEKAARGTYKEMLLTITI